MTLCCDACGLIVDSYFPSVPGDPPFVCDACEANVERLAAPALADKPPADLKESLSSGRKPDITHARRGMLVYIARACEYGDVKYQRANYLRRQPELADDFRRLREYLRAVVSHVYATLDSMEAHQANDPDLTDEFDMVNAAYAADTDATPGAKVGASMLPHLSHAAAALQMAICQAIDAGLLPEDPGRPWESK